MIETNRIDSPLGSWTQARWEPDLGDPLSGAVQRIWDFEGVLANSRERIFPDGTLEIVVQLDEPHRPASSESGPPFPALRVDGLQTASTTIQAPAGRCRVLGIRLRPCAAFALLETSLRELTDRCVDLRDVISQSAGELANRLADAGDGTARVASAEEWARDGLLRRSHRVDPMTSQLLRSIEGERGRLSITQLDHFSGRSRSRLTAAFHDQVGLTPKRYARVIRFWRTLELLEANRSSLTDVAAASGYCDQAHMNSEFRAHAGLTPRAYVEALRYPDSVHLAV